MLVTNWWTESELWHCSCRPATWPRARRPPRWLSPVQRTGTHLGSSVSGGTAWLSSHPGRALWPGRCRPLCGRGGSSGESAPGFDGLLPAATCRRSGGRLIPGDAWRPRSLMRGHRGSDAVSFEHFNLSERFNYYVQNEPSPCLSLIGKMFFNDYSQVSANLSRPP